MKILCKKGKKKSKKGRGGGFFLGGWGGGGGGGRDAVLFVWVRVFVRDPASPTGFLLLCIFWSLIGLFRPVVFICFVMSLRLFIQGRHK